jgi:hypothetical protein
LAGKRAGHGFILRLAQNLDDFMGESCADSMLLIDNGGRTGVVQILVGDLIAAADQETAAECFE